MYLIYKSRDLKNKIQRIYKVRQLKIFATKLNLKKIPLLPMKPTTTPFNLGLEYRIRNEKFN